MTLFGAGLSRIDITVAPEQTLVVVVTADRERTSLGNDRLDVTLR